MQISYRRKNGKRRRTGLLTDIGLDNTILEFQFPKFLLFRVQGLNYMKSMKVVEITRDGQMLLSGYLGHRREG